ncbi:MAG: PAS domain S-box protein [Spirochaetes bacterium]|jgi:PAS domain S-box-containing protein|nr:PAS domain S-box protein [Spirochaetota bacterium]
MTRIMIVEDEPIISLDLEYTLKSSGYEVCGIFTSGESAIENIGSLKPDLVLMDIALSGPMKGIEAADIITKNFEIPVIYLTAHSDKSTVQAAKSSQPYGFINKPVSERDLYSSVETAIQRFALEQKLKESEKLYRTLIENALETILVIQDGKIVFKSPSPRMLSGYDDEEILSTPFINFIHPEDRPLIIENYRRRLSGEVFQTSYNFRIITKSGQTRRLEINSSMITWQNKPGLIIFLKDVTDQIAAEEALLKEQERFKILTDSMPFGIMILGSDAKIKYVNPRFTEITGYESGELPDGGVWAVKAFPDRYYRKMVLDDYNNNLTGGQPGANQSVKFEITCKNGKIKTISFTRVQLENRENLITMEDITGQIEAEKAYFESTQKFTSLFEKSHEGIMIVDNDGTIIEINSAVEKITMMKRQDILWKPVWDVHLSLMNWETRSGLDLESYRKAVISALKNDDAPWIGQITEVSIFPPGGREKIMQIMAFQIKTGRGTMLGITMRDMTESRIIEKTLAEKESTIEAILKSAPVGIGFIRDRVLISANLEMHRLLGYELNFLAGKSTRVLYPDEASYLEAGKKIYENIADGTVEVDLKFVRGDGRQINCRISLAALDPGDISRGLVASLQKIPD